MKCSVLNCKNTHRSKQKPFGFYTFPKDRELHQKWVSFCGRKEVSKSARVCSEHFRPEDFDRSLKYELGFTKFNVLKYGAIPTVIKKDVSPATEARQKCESLRTQKEMVANMLKEAGCTVKMEPYDNSTLTLSSCNIKEETCEPGISNRYLPQQYESLIIDELEQKKQNESRIAELEQKVDELKRENFKLTLSAKDREKEISVLQNRIKSMETNSRILHQQLLNIFSPGQLYKLRIGKTRAGEWSEDDIARANVIYKRSATAYKLLKEMNFPIPSVRTLQRWAQINAAKPGGRGSFETNIIT